MKKTILTSQEDLRSLVIKMLNNNRNFIVKEIKQGEYMVILFEDGDEAWEAFEKLLENGTHKENFYFAIELEGEQYVFKPKSQSLLVMTPS